jgi:hypothetical protein
MRAFAEQVFGNYRAYSVPIDPVEMILDKVVNPAWFIALFSTLAGFAMPGRDAFETLVAVAVLQAGALVAHRSPEIFRAEAETNVLPAVALSSRSLVYLVAVRILPQMSVVACKAVLRDYGRLSFGGFYGCRTNSMPIIVTRSRSRSIG